LLLHRPVISADSNEAGAHLPGSALSAALEPLLSKYRVDVVFQGHQHCGERTAAMFNGTVRTRPDEKNTYWDPKATVFINQATGGAVQDDGWVSPLPEWSLMRATRTYGFGRMTLSTAAAGGNHTLAYSFVSTEGKEVDAWSISKSPRAPEGWVDVL
jgi:hypothetical protein